MNIGGVIKGGLLAGLILNVGEFVLNTLLVGGAWEDIAAELGIVQGPLAMTFYVVCGFVIGIMAVWMYAAMRPRIGPGPLSALKVGLAVWFLAWAWPTLGLVTMDLFPNSLMYTSLLWSIVEVPLAVVAGAWLYREEGGASAEVEEA